MSKLYEIINKLEEVIPVQLIHEKDNSGLLVGVLDNDIKHVRVALEASMTVVDKAIEDGVDLLVVHHPLIFSPISQIVSSTVDGHKLQKLIKNDVALYAVHSNLDRMDAGLNALFGEKAGIIDVMPAEVETEGYVLKGRLPDPISMKALVERLSTTFDVAHIRYVGDSEKLVERVAFCTGSGMSFVSDALFDEADVYITGDLKYHDAMWVHESGYAVIDVTHYGSEIIGVDLLHEILGNVIESDIIVSKDEALTNPIKICEV